MMMVMSGYAIRSVAVLATGLFGIADGESIFVANSEEGC